MGEYQVIKNVILGNNVKIYHFVNLYGCKIGDDSMIGSFVEIQKNASIGRKCKIGTHSFICEGVTIGDNVFIGHHVVFINDKYPVTQIDGKITQDGDWAPISTQVQDGASIGSGVTIMCGVKIGKEAVIGAGSVVTKDVEAFAVIAGNPARPLKNSKAQENKKLLGKTNL
jgi:acetyltransferase-like isoleucine patch superfamily enzyme